jgi:class 3 adenylate cyclase
MTYMSSFAAPHTRKEIEAIGRQSAERNQHDGITGVLLTLGAVFFFQIIEGDEDAIDDLYRRVLRDDRHTDIICLRTEHDVDERLFPDWSMNVFDIDELGGDVIEPLKLLLSRMGEAQNIIERYTQPAVSRIMTAGLNPLDVPLRQVDRIVLFTDMVAFSSISDRLPIDDVSELVTTYLEVCSTAISGHGGEVTKFLGDGVMAYFESALANEALASCVEIQQRLHRIRDEAPKHSALRLLHTGCGLSHGQVIEGTMGSSVKMDYTIIGEPVNTASRVEALTRALAAPVLMTGDVASLADSASEEWTIEFVDEFDLGRGAPQTVHRLVSADTPMIDMRGEVADHLDELTCQLGSDPS